MSRTHLFLNSPTNSCSPMSAMTARKNKNKTRTSLNNFSERSNVFTIARRPKIWRINHCCVFQVNNFWTRLHYATYTTTKHGEKKKERKPGTFRAIKLKPLLCIGLAYDEITRLDPAIIFPWIVEHDTRRVLVWRRIIRSACQRAGSNIWLVTMS